MLANAILDRLVHHAKVIRITESLVDHIEWKII
ncbi:hypothetical protein [Lentilactobacillus hilgardii]|nr:hypothetical protein [Lentilactobacillus hilgardii]